MKLLEARDLFDLGYTFWLEHFRYDILLHEPTQEPAIRCHKCGLISRNPTDVKERYCGNCHEFHSPFL